MSQTTGQLIECHWRMGLAIAGEDLLDDDRGHRINVHTVWITRALGIELITVERYCPGQELTCAQACQTPTTHAITDQTAFVFGDGAANLKQELIVWVIAHGMINKLDATATSS